MSSKETQEIVKDELEAKEVSSQPEVEEEEEEEEEEDYEEAEPVLAYSRMKNDFNEILTKDSVSCIKAGSKVIINKSPKTY